MKIGSLDNTSTEEAHMAHTCVTMLEEGIGKR